MSHASEDDLPTPSHRVCIHRDPRQQDLANGEWQNHPIELIVYDLDTRRHPDNNGSLVKSMRHILYDLGGKLPEDIKTSRGELVVSASPPHPGCLQKTVRITWAPGKWNQKVDLVRGMELVKNELEKLGHEVFWANAAASDCRTAVRFKTCLPDKGGVNNTPRWPFREREPVDWMGTFCPFELCDDVEITVVKGDFKTRYAGNTIEIQLKRPWMVDRMEDLAQTGQEWFERDYGLTGFHRSPAQIPITYPTMIASPGHLEFDVDGSLAELHCWVSAYNEAFHTNECLLKSEDGKEGVIVRYPKITNLVVTPSSLGLAQYLTQQKPRAGHPFEMLYELNGRFLLPKSEAEAAIEKEKHEAESKKIDTILRRLKRIQDHLGMSDSDDEPVERKRKRCYSVSSQLDIISFCLAYTSRMSRPTRTRLAPNQAKRQRVGQGRGCSGQDGP